jgi:hypothetical protein
LDRLSSSLCIVYTSPVTHRIEIEFATPEMRAVAVTLAPGSNAAALSVAVDGETVYSIGAGEAADSGQLNSEIAARLGPPPGEGA